MAAHAYAEGEGLSSQESKAGYAIAIGIIFRPVLITFGFIFAYILITTIGRFVGEALSIFFSSLVGGKMVGIVSSVAIIMIALAAIMMMIKQLLGLFTHLADNVPRWMGGQGASLNEVSSAQSAADASAGVGRTTLKSAIVGAGAAMMKKQDDKKERGQDNPAASKGSTEAK